MEMQSECGGSEGQILREALGSFGWVSVKMYMEQKRGDAAGS